MRLSLIFSVLALTALIFYAATQSLPATINSPASANAEAMLENTTAQFEASRADFDEQVAILNKTIDDLRAESVDQTANLAAALAGRDTIQSQLDEATQRLSSFEEGNVSSATEQAELATELATLKADLESRVSAVRDAEAANQALNDVIELGREEAQTLQATIANLEQQNTDLALQLAENEANTVQPLPTTDGALAEAETLLEQNALALAAAEERIARLTEIATAQVQASSEVAGEVEGFEAQVTTLTAETTTLSDEVAKRDTIIAGLLSRMETSVPSPLAGCQERSDALLSTSQISFETGSATLTADSVPLLEELAIIAADCIQEDLLLEIEGHTDTAGGVASNLLLSDGRAKAVRDFFEANGVPASAMRAVGFGESEPIANDDTSDDQSRNQRVVLDWEQI